MSDNTQKYEDNDDLTPETLNEEDDQNEEHLENESEEDSSSEEASSEETAEEDGDSEVARLKTQLAQMKDQALRALAEAENTRRRAVKEREDASKYAIAGFARDLISVADNLRRALDAVPDDIDGVPEPIAALLTGIEATERELLKAFERHKIKKIEAYDMPFNPNFHEVMFEAPIPDKTPGTVIQVIEEGYILEDRLLRPARVGIAKGEQGAPKTIDTEA
ncbi:MAG: nucleotide exchange factor GrpE [Pseudobdellovibrionaceae bacterium]